jgi:CRISPR/Cas system-associated exonuclease Cas4 (RecB family)
VTEPFYVTPSRISRALECGLKYERQFVLKLPQTNKPGVVMFGGDMQHQALDLWGQHVAREQWGKSGIDLLEAHRDAWWREAPEILTTSKRGKTDEDRRRFSPLGLFLHFEDKVTELSLAEATLEAKILEERPDLKKVRASKEWKEQAPKLDPGSVRVHLDKAKAVLAKLLLDDKLPWRASGPTPADVFLADRAGLAQFVWWWENLDDKPDVVSTEAKERIELDGGTAGFQLTGVIDAVYLWPDGTVEVVDYKRSRGREDAVAKFVQAAAYAETCRKVIGLEPDRVTFHHLNDAERVSFTVSPEWTPQLIQLAERVENMHETNDFPPSFRTCWFCEYVDMCRERFAFMPEITLTAPAEEAV